MKHELGSPSSLPNTKGVRPGCWRAARGKKKTISQEMVNSTSGWNSVSGGPGAAVGGAAVSMSHGTDCVFLGSVRHCGLPSRMAVLLWYSALAKICWGSQEVCYHRGEFPVERRHDAVNIASLWREFLCVRFRLHFFRSVIGLHRLSKWTSIYVQCDTPWAPKHGQLLILLYRRSSG